MGKQGPCCHCGIAITPLWRNGPLDKPVLCNACGSRWRTKGTLLNYMPMHSGGCGVKIGSTEAKLACVKKGSQKIKERHPSKRKEPCDESSEIDYGCQKSNYYMCKGFEEDASTRSSTGSGTSYAESCVQHTVRTERTSESWPPWETPVPSKRRTIKHRHRLSAKKPFCFHSALHKSDSLYTCTPEDLLVEYKPSLMTGEIGLGGIFMSPPVSTVPEQESQASSLMFDCKEFDQFMAQKKVTTTMEEISVAHFQHESIKPTLARGKEKGKQMAKNIDTGRANPVKNLIPNKALLENFPNSKRDVLQSCQSPLVFLELKDIINLDTFMGLLTDQEQCQLMKHVSSADASRPNDSLKSMFNSAQFESALENFQQLLSEGMFDHLESGLSPRVLQHYQQLLRVSDLTSSGWMEQCCQVFNRSKCKSAMEYAKIMQAREFLKERLNGLNAFGAAVPSPPFAVETAKNLSTRSQGSMMIEMEDSYMQSVPSTRCSVHASISSPSILSDATFGKDLQLADLASKEQASSSKDSVIDEESRSGSCFSTNSFYLPNQGTSSLKRYDSIEFLIDEVTEPGILLDLPSNMSFQQAEFLPQSIWKKSSSTKKSENECKQDNSGEFIVKSTWNSEETSNSDGLLWNSPSTGSVHILPNGTLLNPGKMFL